jgi:hypothetical protein
VRAHVEPCSIERGLHVWPLLAASTVTFGPATTSSFFLAGNKEALRAAASFLSARREAAGSPSGPVASPVHAASVPVSPMWSAQRSDGSCQPREHEVGTPLGEGGQAATIAAEDGDMNMEARSQHVDPEGLANRVKGGKSFAPFIN